jgi:salicylate 5-hydroxylase small subunit
MSMFMNAELLLAVSQRNADCAAAIDERRFDEWPKFFTEQGRYRVQGRENHTRGLPLCLIDLQSRAMMHDRVYGITQTIYHQPHYTRHVLGLPRLLSVAQDRAESETSYAVFRTKPGSLGEGVSEVFQVGRYIDAWVREDELWLIADRLCVADTELVLNSLIYPI